MDKRGLLIALSLFFLTMFIAIAIFLYKQSSAGEPVVVENNNNDINMVEVLVPMQRIESGTRLEPSMFKVELRSRFGMSDGYIGNLNLINEMYSRTLIVPGQPLYQDYITKYSPTSPILDKIPEGYRAVAIRVDDISSVEGWARPGTIVDIQWNYTVNNQSGLKVLVQKAQVLSTEKSVAQEQPNAIVPGTVTLLVNAEDAKKITLASSNGKLTLVIRRPEDETIDSGGTITMDNLVGIKPQGPVVLRPNSNGTLTMNGKKYCVGVDGKLFPPDDKGNC